MNSVNASTGFSPFQLRTGRSPRVIPPIHRPAVDQLIDDFDGNAERVAKLVNDIEVDVLEAQDNLLLAKTQQAFAANASRGPEIVYNVGDKVLLSTLHRRREYMQRGDNRAAK
ncbi:hypothetical protein PHLGIDRAFT_60628, partial [Phlebiopsis gigantea 11061_1 CR5-6]